MRDRLDELPEDKEIYTFCAVGLRGYLAQQILQAHGFTRVKNLSGGYKTYSAAVAPLSDQPAPTPSQANIDMETQTENDVKVIRIDACGLQCPGPVMKLKQAIDSIGEGERIEMTATDPGFARDAQAL